MGKHIIWRKPVIWRSPWALRSTRTGKPPLRRRARSMRSTPRARSVRLRPTRPCVRPYQNSYGLQIHPPRRAARPLRRVASMHWRARMSTRTWWRQAGWATPWLACTCFGSRTSGVRAARLESSRDPFPLPSAHVAGHPAAWAGCYRWKHALDCAEQQRYRAAGEGSEFIQLPKKQRKDPLARANAILPVPPRVVFFPHAPVRVPWS